MESFLVRCRCFGTLTKKVHNKNIARNTYILVLGLLDVKNFFYPELHSLAGETIVLDFTEPDVYTRGEQKRTELAKNNPERF